jgi:ABC-2 type transport system permease protein
MQLLQSIDPRRPVFIQAYLSPDVPRSYLPVRASLSNFLREYAAIGRERLNVRIVDTVKYSPEAREARERYGINPFRVPVTEESAQTNNEIFLGLVFSSGGEEFVIPQFDRGLPVEYELTRSIRVVSRAKRKKVGVLQTGASLFGGFDFQRRANTNEWSIVSELKKQYEVTQIAPAADYPEDIDVLVAVLPHTLSIPDLARLTAYVQKGKPALIVVDPLPAFNLQLSPAAAAEQPAEGVPATTVSDTRPLMNALGVEWNPAAVVWDTYNPHPQLRSLPPEIVFIGKGNQGPMPFQTKEETTSGLQEVVLIYPGELKEQSGSRNKFTPLLTTGTSSGTLRWNQIVQRTMFGTSMVQGQPHNPSGKTAVVAARVGNAIVFADADMIGEQFFDIRKSGVEYLNLDNVTLALNAIDDLAGEKNFISLRKRRPRHRTLEAVEARTRQYEQQRDVEMQQAATIAAQRLKEAQARLDQAVAGIEGRQDLDDQAKQIMISSVQSAENRRLQVARTNIEDERQRQLENARAAMESSIRGIQNTIKLLAVALPPIPAFILFIVMSIRKLAREQARIAPERRV